MKKVSIQRSHNPLIRFCVYVFAAYVAVSLITLQMQINDNKTQLQQVTAQCKEAADQQQELQRQLALGDDDEQMARIARDKLDMGFAGEHVFRDVSGS